MAKQKYHFSVKTKDEYLAGTDSNIFFKLYGERGISNEVRTNGYISGNAYERNQTDTFEIDFDNDCGDIYKIQVRSDKMWAGADWMCESIRVKRVGGQGNDHETFISVDKWINKKDPYEFTATSGFTATVPEAAPQYLKIIGPTHYIPPYVQMKIACQTEVSVSVDYTAVDITEIATGVSVEADFGVAQAAVETEITTSLERQLGQKLGQVLTRYSEAVVESSPKERMLTEVWQERDLQFKATLGMDYYTFTVPQDRVFAGFIEAKEPTPQAALEARNAPLSR